MICRRYVLYLSVIFNYHALYKVIITESCKLHGCKQNIMNDEQEIENSTEKVITRISKLHTTEPE